MVGLARPFGKVFDLIVFDGNFGTKKADLSVLFIETLFELLNIAERVGACSGMLLPVFLNRHSGTCGSRRECVGPCSSEIRLLIFAERTGTCGSLLRCVSDVMRLLQKFDQLVRGCGIDEILKSVGAKFFFAAERADTTVALDALGMTWKACGSEPSLGLDDGDRIIEMFLYGGIGGSLFRHALDDTPARRTARRLSTPVRLLQTFLRGLQFQHGKQKEKRDLGTLGIHPRPYGDEGRHPDLKGDIVRLGEQVTSIETEIRGMKRAQLEFRVADLEEKVFGKSRA